MLNRRFDIWLPSYGLMAAERARARRARRGRLTHIMMLVCDHFEPRHGVEHDNQPFARLQAWQQGYAQIQQRCRKSFGTAPVHTWFYPPHHGDEHLESLAQMAFDGLGEVELHYHHHGDTSETLRRDLSASIAQYQRWGVLLESGESPRTAFGFIHGDWALGNSCGGAFCGVNDEVTLLQELGCWGDFTMPSGNRCQTRKINSIYYGVGDPNRPKAHDTGPDARVGQPAPAGLFMMQGPLGINWRAPGHPRPENGSLTSLNWGRPDRIPVWLNCNVHVGGRPDWLFVKLHAHGAIERDFDALFGDKAFEMHRVLNEQYNDGEHFRLHYVTARQAYNIAKAAESGAQGDPSDWLDYRIQAPATRFYTINARHRLLCCTAERLVLTEIDADGAQRPGQPPQELAGNGIARLRTRLGRICELAGPLGTVDIDVRAHQIRFETRGDKAEVLLEVDGALGDHAVEGADVIDRVPHAVGCTVRLRVARQCTVKTA